MILFKPKLHKRYLTYVLKNYLPSKSVDATRVTLAFFAISGLDVLNGLEDLEVYKNIMIEWIYLFQTSREKRAGFLNSLSFSQIGHYKNGHIAATYSALNSLVILGDDLSRVDRKSIIQSLKFLQLDDGSFEGVVGGAENDMRFVYCAAGISYILNDFSGMDVEKAVQYVLNSFSYDGGIAQGPDLESHGGSTYCALATLALMNQLNRISEEKMYKLRQWLLRLQKNGFQGRPNKAEDSCYTFWVGGALKIIESYDLIDEEALQNFVLATQDFNKGGLSKWPNYDSDPLHTYLGLAGLSLMKFEGLNEVVPMLNMSVRAHQHLKTLHGLWS